MKDNLLVSFSGGETSAYMAQWLWKNKQSEYNMRFVFANTGQENEETLEFVDRCSKYFGFPVVWVEAVVHHGKRKGCTHKIVSYDTASRMGEPFEDVIKKYGIPNMSFLHCTRELKANPILSYALEVFGERPYMAIGIREDEFDRISKNRIRDKIVYPLISDRPMTKSKINFWWSQQPFRLDLKNYQGNCKVCHKKTDSKLFQIAKENESAFNFTLRMEEKYGRVGAEFKKDKTAPSRVFFRKHRSSNDIIRESLKWNGSISEINTDEPVQCEIWSDCGD